MPALRSLDGVEMFSAFCQQQNLAALLEGLEHLRSDGVSARLIVDQMPKYLLNARLWRQLDARKAGVRYDLQGVW